jgi:hypothetical protein
MVGWELEGPGLKSKLSYYLAQGPRTGNLFTLIFLICEVGNRKGTMSLSEFLGG